MIKSPKALLLGRPMVAISAEKKDDDVVHYLLVNGGLLVSPRQSLFLPFYD